MPASALLLLPRALEGFILREQAEDLLRAPRVVAAGPGRVPYGVYGRVPDATARVIARAAARAVSALPDLRVVAIFHPLQLPVAEALLTHLPGAELWYARWDRYEAALDAGPVRRARLRALHERAAARSALTFAASGALAGDGDVVVGLSADAFPAGEWPAEGDGPCESAEEEEVVAWSLGHVGRRIDWALLRGVLEAMPELRVLFVGELHAREMAGDADFDACRAASAVTFCGAQDDEAAARLLAGADVGIVPFTVNAFNDAGLPYRILKAARHGRRSVTPMLEGVRTWERAVVRADGVREWVAALRAERGRRSAPDLELRTWALEQTAEKVNAPLWARLRELGVA